MSSTAEATREIADAVRRMAHILGAERVWLARIQEEPWEADWIWPDHDLDTCVRPADGLTVDWERLGGRLDARLLERAVGYENSRGDRFDSSVRDILTHLFAHGAHHRGQIASALRRAGALPRRTTSSSTPGRSRGDTAASRGGTAASRGDTAASRGDTAASSERLSRTAVSDAS